MVKQPAKRTDPSTLVICDDPLPTHRTVTDKKYDAKISAMKMGQALKCAPGSVGGVAGAMRKYIETHKIAAHVKTVKNYGDGFGRVWMMANPVEAKAKLAAVKG